MTFIATFFNRNYRAENLVDNKFLYLTFGSDFLAHLCFLLFSVFLSDFNRSLTGRLEFQGEIRNCGTNGYREFELIIGQANLTFNRPG